MANAEEMAEQIRQAERARQLAANIQRLCGKRIEYKHRETYKRKRSFKGRVFGKILDVEDEADDDILTRPRSRAMDRADKLRPMVRERNINFNK